MKYIKILNTIALYLLFSFVSLHLSGQRIKIIDSLNTRAFELRFYEPEIAHYFSSKAIMLAEADSLNSSYILSLRNAGMSMFALSKHESSIMYLNRALNISGLIKDSVSMSACLNNLYIVHKSIGNTKEAKHYLQLSLKTDFALKDTAGIAAGLNYLAEFYYNDGQNEKALQLYTKSAALATQAGDMTGAADALNNIAAVYYQTKNYHLSLYFYHKSLELYTEYEYPTGIAMTMSNIALALSEIKQGENALKYINKSIEIYTGTNDQRGLAQSYFTKAKVYQSLDSISEAEYYFYKATNLALEVGNYILLANGFNSHAEFFLSQKDTLQAIQSYQNCLEFSRDLEFGTLIINSLENLVNIFSSSGQFENAFHYQNELQIFINTGKYSNPEIDVIKLRHEAKPDKDLIIRNLKITIVIFLIIILFLTSLSIILFYQVRRKNKLQRVD